MLRNPAVACTRGPGPAHQTTASLALVRVLQAELPASGGDAEWRRACAARRQHERLLLQERAGQENQGESQMVGVMVWAEGGSPLGWGVRDSLPLSVPSSWLF